MERLVALRQDISVVDILEPGRGGWYPEEMRLGVSIEDTEDFAGVSGTDLSIFSRKIKKIHANNCLL